MADAEHVVLSTRIATLILLLYGTPVSKTCELTKEIDPASLADLLGYSRKGHEHPRCPRRSPDGRLPTGQKTTRPVRLTG